VSAKTFFRIGRAVTGFVCVGDVTRPLVDQEGQERSRRARVLGEGDADSGCAGDQAAARAAEPVRSKNGVAWFAVAGTEAVGSLISFTNVRFWG
jgi:hypothetical protein